MAYQLCAVAAASAAVQIAEALGCSVVDLPGGLVLIPITDWVPAASTSDPALVDTFEYLTVGLQDLLVLASTDGPVAYLEAEIFGGLGTQAAAVWDGRHIVTGPVRHDNEVEPDVPATLWPFNLRSVWDEPRPPARRCGYGGTGRS
ncbi:hypothetical protein [Frankia sp. Cr2]|uniref:hypothetical protein n=1 Tax=Frankia sp. Cr2 TaxID=3073932 RepID=UPI002AD2FC48|nr:hypothetical protein [Frankia sp. Cr2]